MSDKHTMIVDALRLRENVFVRTYMYAKHLTSADMLIALGAPACLIATAALMQDHDLVQQWTSEVGITPDDGAPQNLAELMLCDTLVGLMKHLCKEAVRRSPALSKAGFSLSVTLDSKADRYHSTANLRRDKVLGSFQNGLSNLTTSKSVAVEKRGLDQLFADGESSLFKRVAKLSRAAKRSCRRELAKIEQQYTRGNDMEKIDNSSMYKNAADSEVNRMKSIGRLLRRTNARAVKMAREAEQQRNAKAAEKQLEAEAAKRQRKAKQRALKAATTRVKRRRTNQNATSAR